MGSPAAAEEGGEAMGGGRGEIEEREKLLKLRMQQETLKSKDTQKR